MESDETEESIRYDEVEKFEPVVVERVDAAVRRVS